MTRYSGATTEDHISDFTGKQLTAARLFATGHTEREIAEKLDVARSTPNYWKKNPEFINLIERFKLEFLKHSQEHIEAETQLYIEELKTVKERQKKWGAAVTEAGIKALKIVNKSMVIIEAAIDRQGQGFTQKEALLAKIVPSYMRAAGDMIKAAADAEDRAFGLNQLTQELDELSTSIAEKN